jgi:hypothetical protein
MSLPAFLTALFDTGRVAVSAPIATETVRQRADAAAILSAQVEVLRVEFPGQPPPLDKAAALWAAISLYRACQLAVYRQLDVEAIDELLGQACPAADSASRHWSVDVTFRFLPDLLRLAMSASPEDPLLARLGQWCSQWPLSAVGVGAESLPDIGSPEAIARESEVAAHPGLLQLYADRILAKKDWARLRHPSVRAAVQRSLGAYQERFPEAAKALAAAELSGIQA